MLRTAARLNASLASAGPSRIRDHVIRTTVPLKKRGEWPRKPRDIRTPDVPKATKPLTQQRLRPASLSALVHKVSEEDGVEHALGMVEKSPRGAQNTTVWNTLIHQAMDKKSYSLAYRIFIAMKRRGFSPDAGTYATLLSGYDRIRDWQSCSKQLENVHNVHNDYFERCANLHPQDFHTSPTSKYISILTQAGQFDRIFDVLDSLKNPNAHTFGAVFRALTLRKNTEKLDGLSIAEQNASDAKLLWRRVLDVQSRTGQQIADAFIVSRVLVLLLRGRESDKRFALEIAQEYAGLPISNDIDAPKPGWKTEDPTAVSVAVLSLCVSAGEWKRAALYGDELLRLRVPMRRAMVLQLMIAYTNLAKQETETASDAGSTQTDWAKVAVSVIRRMSVEGALKIPRDEDLLPSSRIYELAIQICASSGDWTRACSLFQAITGYDPASFTLSEKRLRLRSEDSTTKRSEVHTTVPIGDKGQAAQHYPTPVVLLQMLRTAVVSREPRAMLQALQMYTHFCGSAGPPKIDEWRRLSHGTIRDFGSGAWDSKFVRECEPRLKECLARIFRAVYDAQEMDEETSLRMKPLRDWCHGVVQKVPVSSLK